MKAISILFLVSIASAQILNGGFESNSCGSDLWCTYGPGYFLGDNSWDCYYGTIDVHHSNVAQLSCFEGDFCVDLSGNEEGGITQAFSTIVGHSYTISWMQSGNFNCAPTIKQMDVTVNFAHGAPPAPTQTYYFDTTGIDSTNMNWQSASYSFTAIQYLSAVYFSSDTPSSCGLLIDAVTLTDNSLADPTAFCATVDTSQWTYGQGYYCANENAGFYQCYGDTNDLEGNYQNCPLGTVCICAPGDECSNHGTSTPCQSGN